MVGVDQLDDGQELDLAELEHDGQAKGPRVGRQLVGKPAGESRLLPPALVVPELAEAVIALTIDLDPGSVAEVAVERGNRDLEQAAHVVVLAPVGPAVDAAVVPELRPLGALLVRKLEDRLRKAHADVQHHFVVVLAADAADEAQRTTPPRPSRRTIRGRAASGAGSAAPPGG